MALFLVHDQQDLSEVKDFLRANGLPSEDVKLEGSLFIIHRDANGKIIGCGGLEFHGSYGLLRSIAVASEFRRTGCGKEIVEYLITRATEKGLLGVLLLTETAPSFFEKFGFNNQSRDDAPVQIRSSSEFSSVCPVSAIMMSLSLKPTEKAII